MAKTPVQQAVLRSPTTKERVRGAFQDMLAGDIDPLITSLLWPFSTPAPLEERRQQLVQRIPDGYARLAADLGSDLAAPSNLDVLSLGASVPLTRFVRGAKGAKKILNVPLREGFRRYQTKVAAGEFPESALRRRTLEKAKWVYKQTPIDTLEKIRTKLDKEVRPLGGGGDALDEGGSAWDVYTPITAEKEARTLAEITTPRPKAGTGAAWFEERQALGLDKSARESERADLVSKLWQRLITNGRWSPIAAQIGKVDADYVRIQKTLAEIREAAGTPGTGDPWKHINTPDPPRAPFAESVPSGPQRTTTPIAVVGGEHLPVHLKDLAQDLALELAVQGKKVRLSQSQGLSSAVGSAMPQKQAAVYGTGTRGRYTKPLEQQEVAGLDDRTGLPWKVTTSTPRAIDAHRIPGVNIQETPEFQHILKRIQGSAEGTGTSEDYLNAARILQLLGPDLKSGASRVLSYQASPLVRDVAKAANIPLSDFDDAELVARLLEKFPAKTPVGAAQEKRLRIANLP